MKTAVWLQMLIVGFSIAVVESQQPAFAAGVEEPSEAALEQGKALVVENCVSCHAVTTEGRSQHAEAPPFRDLARRYSVWLLAESLAEGIVSGHPDMPEFVFEPPEIHAILSYMDSLKGNGVSPP